MKKALFTEKQLFAAELIRASKSNSEIQAELKKKFRQEMGRTPLARLRKTMKHKPFLVEASKVALSTPLLCKNGHSLAEFSFKDGKGYSRCRACVRAGQSRYEKKKQRKASTTGLRPDGSRYFSTPNAPLPPIPASFELKEIREEYEEITNLYSMASALSLDPKKILNDLAKSWLHAINLPLLTVRNVSGDEEQIERADYRREVKP